MPQPFHEIFSAREYLETYYPDNFDQEQFLAAIKTVSQEMQERGKIDVGLFRQKTGLADEVIENVAIMHFLSGVSRRLLEVFPRGDAVLLDVGAGPTIYQHIPFCLNVSSIVHAEFLSENREEVLMYLTEKKEAYLWDGYFSVVRAIFSGHKSYQALLEAQEVSEDQAVRNHASFVKRILFSDNNDAFKEHLRNTIGKNVVSCNIFSDSLEIEGDSSLSGALGKSAKQGSPDIVSAHFLVESATESRKQWEQGIIHLIQKLRPGGYFIMTAIRNATWYRVGSEKVPAVAVNEKGIRNFLEEHGIVIEDMQILVGSDQADHGYDGMVFVFGRKSFS